MNAVGRSRTKSKWKKKYVERINNQYRTRHVSISMYRPVVESSFKVLRGIWNGHVQMIDVDDDRKFTISHYDWACMLRDRPDIFIGPGLFKDTMMIVKKHDYVFLEPVSIDNYIHIDSLDEEFNPDLDELLGF